MLPKYDLAAVTCQTRARGSRRCMALQVLNPFSCDYSCGSELFMEENTVVEDAATLNAVATSHVVVPDTTACVSVGQHLDAPSRSIGVRGGEWGQSLVIRSIAEEDMCVRGGEWGQSLVIRSIAEEDMCMQ